MLTIPLSTVGWIILKAREYDAKEAGPVDPEDVDDADNPLGVLEDRADDPTVIELTSWIGDLNRTQQAELVALFWLGRDEYDAEEFPDLVEQARGHQGAVPSPYLLGSPMLGDYLEEGLEKLGYDSSTIESELG